MEFCVLKKKLRRDNPRWVILLIDMCIVLMCYLVSNFIIDGFRGNYDIPLILKKSVLIGITYILIFLRFGTYKGIIRQAGIRDATQVFKAVFISFVLLTILTVFFRYNITKSTLLGDYLRLSYSVLFMHSFFTMVAMVAARIFYRTLYEAFFFGKRKRANALIFGASHSGLIALSLLKEDSRVKHRVFAFVEDNGTRIGKHLSGYRILDIHTIDTEFIEHNHIDSVIIAVENNDPDRLRVVSEIFEKLGLYIKILPPVFSQINADVERQIRALKIEDLLGRKTIELNNPEIDIEMRGKSILITGAAGSIGSELVRQIAIRSFSKLIALDQSESPLYDLQQSLNANKPKDIEFIVGNVRDRNFMERLFEKYTPDLVFHAAAYKHVPLMERNPYEAILTNVLGTKNVVDMAMKFGAKKFVMVSTDKVVNPTNVMGATKRVAELYVNSCSARSGTSFMITRFGNVLGSNGSVIPLFERQIETGGPLTLTHLGVTRYFMTISEACQLVQEAGVMGKGGEIFVFDMGESVKIFDLAKRMIRLKGLRYPQDIDIMITGLRPGEKIFEELLADEETTVKTHHKKIMIAQVRQENLVQKHQLIEKLCRQVTNLDSSEMNPLELVRLLKEIVPEYVSQNSKYEVLDQPIVKKEGIVMYANDTISF